MYIDPQYQGYTKRSLCLDEFRTYPALDDPRLTELKQQEQNYWHLVADCKGAQDAGQLEFRWLLEELRVTFFA